MSWAKGGSLQDPVSDIRGGGCLEVGIIEGFLCMGRSFQNDRIDIEWAPECLPFIRLFFWDEDVVEQVDILPSPREVAREGALSGGGILVGLL
jgi:hypothetical protein